MKYVVVKGYVYKDKHGAHKEGAVVECSPENYKLNHWKLKEYDEPKKEVVHVEEEKTSGEQEEKTSEPEGDTNPKTYGKYSHHKKLRK